MRQSAALSCLSPPRLSRCRLVLPLLAGIGLAPARAAKDRSLRSRCVLSPALTRIVDATSGPTPFMATSSGATALVIRWSRTALHDFQQSQRLHWAVMRLRRSGGLTGQHRSGGRDRVDDVGLAVLAADLPVGPRHLDHQDVLLGQIPGQRRPVTAGALDPDG